MNLVKLKKHSYISFKSVSCFTFIVCGVLLPFFLFGQFDFSKDSVRSRLSYDMLVLTSDSLQGRQAGTIFEIKARNFIALRYKEAALIPIIGDTSYFQKFMRKGRSETFYNVCGFLDNKAEKTVVIGAHYDHLGMGYFGSRYGSGKIHRGADDNASGVISVMEMARYLKCHQSLKYNYLFVAFTGEEMGLYGSDFFVNSKIAKRFKIAYMINFDMVGRYDYNNKKRIILFGSGSSPQWKRILKENKPNNFKIKKIKYGPSFSDHTAFYNNNIPLLYFTTGTPEVYHTPLDTYETINFDGMADILEYVESLTQQIEKTDHISFKKNTNFQIFRAYFFAFTEMQ